MHTLCLLIILSQQPDIPRVHNPGRAYILIAPRKAPYVPVWYNTICIVINGKAYFERPVDGIVLKEVYIEEDTTDIKYTPEPTPEWFWRNRSYWTPD